MTKYDLQAQIKNKGLTIEQAAEKVGVTRKTLHTYMDKFEKRELSDKIFNSLAESLNLDKEFINEYRNKLATEGLKLSSFWPFLIIPGGQVTGNYTFLDSTTKITESLLESLPTQKYSVFHIENDKMAPSIKNGDLVICEEVPVKFWYRSSDYFIYLIVSSNEEAYVARKFQSGDDIWHLKMDNEDESIKFDSSTIEGLFLVRRIIQLNDAGPKMFETSK